ncbi:uncharacterized protein XM38_034900 [Halomicronema hongdechloris C2206]|uniref:Peptidase C14 caspase domain-containing protein n=1 Tax=Halomicronema hongdechloris C2206 TaxID=1641165 RepID=A0A1Z3HQJ6_9CYAN|nr:caspase family protein [Halomicronema hongdechloris]ASC72532.1 uncharacterized protein XM38_034900 [Halomicronema hongdechloris C2206]
MGLNRRAFLQQVGLALLALGVSESTLMGWAGRYQQALAQPARRKLALLVGINEYPATVLEVSGTQPLGLRGTLMDVEMQRELLIHRFGFSASDIVLLTNAQATRTGIIDAFQHHLIDQAQPGDAVLFHFSGYGSQIRLADQPDVCRRSLVPVDGQLPTEKQPQIADLMEDSLHQLLRALNTSRVTTVLDVGYRELGQVRWGNLRSRSRPNAPTGQLDDATRQLWERLGQGADPSNSLGVILQASGENQIALEGEWPDFSAGIFTYALTQQLWESLPSIDLRVVMSRTGTTVQRWTGPDQQPQLQSQASSSMAMTPYGVPLKLTRPADGIVTDTMPADHRVKLWLGGLPPAVLAYLGDRSVFSWGDTDQAEATLATTLQIQSRQGLVAVGQPRTAEMSLPQVGERVYERVRVLPRQLDLVVALDKSLERIERVDATSALSGIPFVSSTVAGEQPADCLFGRLPAKARQLLASALPNFHETSDAMLSMAQGDSEADPAGGYGLFSPNRTLMPETLADHEEAVKTAVSRMTPYLQTLLAAKLLRLTDNQTASRVAVRASLEMVAPRERLLMQQQTVRSHPALPESRLARLMRDNGSAVALSADSRVRYRIDNFGQQPLYLTLMTIDSSGRAAVFSPGIFQARRGEEGLIIDTDTAAIPAGGNLVLPDANGNWGLPKSTAWVDTYLLLSVQPFRRTWERLWTLFEGSGDRRQLRSLEDPLTIARDILADLNAASQSQEEETSSSTPYRLNMDTWATLAFRYQVV